MRFVAAVALATLGFAQSPSDAQKPGRLSGHVLSQSGAPVRRATVKLQDSAQPISVATLQGAATYSKTTDDAGAFLFDNVAPGRYTLSSEKTGFLPQRYGAHSENGPGTPLVLAAGAEMKDLVVKMTPQAVITGRVIDQDGDPVANAQVTAYQYGYSNGRRQLMPAGSSAAAGAALGALLGGGGGGPGTSDDQGNYRIVNLAPGRYYVSADPRTNRGILGIIQGQVAGRGGAPKPAVPEPSNITTFYPNSTDAQGAVALDVVGGSEIRGIDIRVRKERVYSIRGKVVDTASGGPAAGAAIMLLPPDANDANAVAMLSNMSSTGTDGNFEIRDLLPGRYTIQGLSVVGPGGLTPNGAAGRGGGAPATPLQMQPRATNRIEIGISDSDVTDAVLQLSGGTELSGTVKLEDGNLKEILQPGQTNRRILLMVSSGVNLIAPNGPFADDGIFSITGVYPAKYYLTVAGLPQGTYVKSIKLGGQDATKTPLDLTDGGGPLQIVLSSKAADITGTVHNEKGEPVQGVPVTLWPKVADHGSPNSGIRNANTDQNGTLKIAGLAPGDYFVAAWDDIPEA